MAGTPPTPIQCSVRGEKFVAPLTGAAICQRFVAAYARASGSAATARPTAPADGLVIALNFLPQGVASAQVTRMRGGKPLAPLSFNLAVSDRPFHADDVDRLAASTAQGLRTASPR